MRKIWRNLLLPYCFFVVLGSALKYDITISMWSSNAFKECFRIVHGEGSESIWFLVCLAVVQVIAWCFCKQTGGVGDARICMLFILALLLGVVINDCLSKYAIKFFPFMLASAPAGVLFFVVGMRFREQLIRFSASNMTVFMCGVVFVTLVILLIVLNTLVVKTFDIRTGRFDVKVLPSCFCGIAMVFVVAKGVCKFSLAKKTVCGHW